MKNKIISLLFALISVFLLAYSSTLLAKMDTKYLGLSNVASCLVDLDNVDCDKEPQE
jgi:hypothetical protein